MFAEFKQNVNSQTPATLDLMNNNRKKHIWTFICLLFSFTLTLCGTFSTHLFILLSIFLCLSSALNLDGLHLVCRRLCLQKKTTEHSFEGRDFCSVKRLEFFFFFNWIIYMVKLESCHCHKPVLHVLCKNAPNMMAVIWEVRHDSWAGWRRSGRLEGRGFIWGAQSLQTLVF